ncbi:MAG: YfhO family protein [Acidobacteriota bacterium]
MATTRKEKKPAAPGPGLQNLSLPVQHAIASGILFVALLVFFHGAVFDGKVFTSGDTVASHSLETYVNDAHEQGTFPLWNPYIFCGMPAYASLSISAERMFDISDFLWQKSRDITKFLFLNAEMGATLFYYLLFSVGMYLFAYAKLKHWLASLLVALGATFSMFIIIWVMVGHVTKIGVISWVPYIFLIVEQLRERFDLRRALLLTVVLHLAFGPSHMQMLFYVYFALGLYFLFFLIRSLVVKEPVKNLILAGCVLAAATGLAFAMNADQYLSTLEYNPYSIRGSSPIVQQTTAGEQTEAPKSGGLDYDYATRWSFSPGEMLTFFIPSAYGFGGSEYQGVLTQNRAVHINTYFGPQDFTDGPQYMGLVILLLAVAGVILKRRDPFVQYLAALVVISLLISFGREFSLVYDLMFKYFPIFNKFRIPSMILVLVQLAVPLLAGYGIVALTTEGLAPASAKKWNIAAAVFVVLAILSVVAKDLFLGIYQIFVPKSEAVASFGRMAGGRQEIIDELYKYVLSMVSSDFTIAFLLIAASIAAVTFYRQKKISAVVFSAIMIVIVTGDLWHVAAKPMELHERGAVDAQFASAPDYVKFLQQDKSMFRTLEFVGGAPPYDNRLAYWRIQSAYGYQGAKMRAWQDMVDVANIGNPLVWGLMNVKYILEDRVDSNQVLTPVFVGQERAVMENKMTLPRAFFVNRYEVASGIEILKKIAAMNFNPTDVMYLMDKPNVNVAPAGPGASAKYTKFGINDLEIEATATGDNLLFVSEAFYPNGWKAFIDGKETPIYRANYLFRAVVVPSGTHTVVMKFEPRGFSLGRNLSLGINILVLGALGFLFGKTYLKKKQ